ncbi:MAG: hypothetical protein JWM83_1830 [Candidatus Angelobacter sp.]|nr:hypothetical protein [Candidatus Angelobacter sp.]
MVAKGFLPFDKLRVGISEQLTRRPVHLSPTEQMQMQMENCLACVRTHVIDRTESVLQFAFPSYLCRDQLAIAHQFRIRFRSLVNAHNMFLGDDQHMRRRLRFDVFKRKGLFVFVNFFSRNFSGDDFAEKTVSHNREC